MHYDDLVVGAGLFGAVFAHEMQKHGRKVLVIEKKDHIAGNIYTEEVMGINVHRFGAHIFHTSDREVWEYVNQFAHFNHYINSPIAVWRDELYNLPFNMNTFSRMWNIRKPAQAKEKIASQIGELSIGFPCALPTTTTISTTLTRASRREATPGSWRSFWRAARSARTVPGRIFRRKMQAGRKKKRPPGTALCIRE